MVNPAEVWKAQKHGFDVWPDVLRHAAAGTPMKDIATPDLERMKWYGFFYRRRDEPGRYMNRIRITAGELSSAQAREVAAIAYEYGHGIVDVTTRANLQVQGIDIRHVPAVADRLAAVGTDVQADRARQHPQRVRAPVQRGARRRADRHARDCAAP